MCSAFLTNTEACEELLAATKLVMGRPDLPFPGWKSVGHVLAFLRVEVGKDTVASKMLRTVMEDAGAMRPPFQRGSQAV